MLSHLRSTSASTILALAVAVLLLTPLLVEPRSRTLALGTLLLASSVCAISVPLGTLLAVLITRTDMPLRRLAGLVLAVLLFAPLVTLAAGWDAGFGISGVVTTITGGAPMLAGWRGAIWVHAVAAIPAVTLIVSLGLRIAPAELEEEALMDASPAVVLLRVTLRRAAPAIGAAALWVAVTTSTQITVTDLFQVRTFAEEIYVQQAVSGSLGQPTLTSWSVLMFTAWIVIVGLVLCASLAPVQRSPVMRSASRLALGRWRLPAVIVTVLLVALLAGVPLTNLCYKAGVLVTQVDAERVRTWSAAKLLRVLVESPGRYGKVLKWSLLISSTAATAAVAIAIPIAWSARRGGARAAAALFTAGFLLAVPGPLVGAAVSKLLNRPEVPGLVFLYDRSIAAPWIAQTLRATPLAILVLWHSLRDVSSDVLSAATVEGAGRLTRLTHIVLAARMPALALTWLVALAVALSELGATTLVSPPGKTTVTTRIFELLHYGVEDRLAGICLLLLAVTAIIAAVSMRLAKHVEP